MSRTYRDHFPFNSYTFPKNIKEYYIFINGRLQIFKLKTELSESEKLSFSQKQSTLDKSRWSYKWWAKRYYNRTAWGKMYVDDTNIKEYNQFLREYNLPTKKLRDKNKDYSRWYNW